MWGNNNITSAWRFIARRSLVLSLWFALRLSWQEPVAPDNLVTVLKNQSHYKDIFCMVFNFIGRFGFFLMIYGFYVFFFVGTERPQKFLSKTFFDLTSAMLNASFWILKIWCPFVIIDPKKATTLRLAGFWENDDVIMNIENLMSHS